MGNTLDNLFKGQIKYLEYFINMISVKKKIKEFGKKFFSINYIQILLFSKLFQKNQKFLKKMIKKMMIMDLIAVIIYCIKMKQNY